MTRGRAHVVGAGLAGLSAAVRLAEAGWKVVLYEAGPQAGGRCRSFHDDLLGLTIDNGNHLLLSGNRSARAYLATIGAGDTLDGPEETRFDFTDLTDGARWTLAPGNSRLPWWLLDRQRRVPGLGLGDYLQGLKLARARPDQTVEAVLGGRPLAYRLLWQPMAVAVLSTDPREAAASLLWPVLAETIGRGGQACRPLIARVGLSESFVAPALAWLALRGGRLFTGTRVRALDVDGERVTALDLAGEGSVALDPGDAVVLAVPPPVARQLIPDLVVPTEFRAILNLHFKPAAPPFDGVRLDGVLGATTEWIVRRGPLVSVTVSAADRLMDEPEAPLAARIWDEVARVCALPPQPVPPVRVIREKRATIAQTPSQLRLRPKAPTRWRNLALAGDWTDTGLPATIEGAIRSGEIAARLLTAASGRG